MRMIVFVVVLFGLNYCTTNQKRVNNDVEIRLDSIFINGYEKGEYFYPSVIYFNYTVTNGSKDTIRVKLKRYDYDKISNIQNPVCIYRKIDTLVLYAGANTDREVILLPKTKTSIDLNLNPSDLQDLREKYKSEYPVLQDFLKDLAENCNNYFYFGRLTEFDKKSSRFIKFRNPNDSLDIEWKF